MILDFLRDNLWKVMDEISETCMRCSGDFSSITLCAVSKKQPIEYVDALFHYGVSVFGENYIQEIESKYATSRIAVEREYSLRMIGHLQSNKVFKAVSIVDCIDSVDSSLLLRKINDTAGRIGKRIEVLFEINSAGEQSKSGFRDMDDYRLALDLLPTLKNVDFRGLMTMGPADGSDLDTRRAFERFMKIYDKSRAEHSELHFDKRSFGMSGDYKIALEMGSNMLRIGTALFGPRDYSK